MGFRCGHKQATKFSRQRTQKFDLFLLPAGVTNLYTLFTSSVAMKVFCVDFVAIMT